MGLIRLNDGTQFEIFDAVYSHGIMRNRSRDILEIFFKADISRFEEIKAKFTPENLQKIDVFYPDEKEGTSDDILFAEDGPAHTTYEYYDIIGEIKEKEEEIVPETATSLGTWEMRLSIELGQSLITERNTTVQRAISKLPVGPTPVVVEEEKVSE